MTRPLGKGEVESSILSCSTMNPQENKGENLAGAETDCADLRMNDSGTAAGNWQGRPGYLYRHWSEAGDLLYVGISINAVARLAQHRGKLWFPQIAKITVQRFDDYAEAERAELVAICDEKPLHNAKGPRNRTELRSALGKLKTAQKRALKKEAIRISRVRRMFNIDAMFGVIPASLTFEEYAVDPKRWHQ